MMSTGIIHATKHESSFNVGRQAGEFKALKIHSEIKSGIKLCA